MSLTGTFLPKVTNMGTLFGGAQATNVTRADGKPYILPSYHTVDLSVSYTLPSFGRKWAKNVSVTAGALNLLDAAAPYASGVGGNQSEANMNKSTYDIIGRQIFVELKKEF